jgi:hypothetical protein
MRSGNLELARQIRAAGIQICISEDDSDVRSVSSDGLRICQFGGLVESAAFDWFGGTGFIIWLVITIELSGFAVSSFDLELPWTDTIRLLEDPLEIDGASTVYRFGGRDSLEFNRDEVLNHRADVQRIMPHFPPSPRPPLQPAYQNPQRSAQARDTLKMGRDWPLMPTIRPERAGDTLSRVNR